MGTAWLLGGCSSASEDAPRAIAAESRAVSTAITGVTSPFAGRALLANARLAQQPMKGVFYFPGDWEATSPLQFYGRYSSLGGNASLYTLHPADARHLGFSETADDRAFAVQAIAQTGANVIVMSYWGPPSSDQWMFWAPMQDAPQAQEELFDAAAGRDLVIMPSIEDSDPTSCSGGQSPGFRLAEMFPNGVDAIANGAPANPLLAWVVDLVNRFIASPRNANWPDHFAQMYDRDGTPRYVIQLKDVASTQAGVDDLSFVQGFEKLARAVKSLTGVDVGFVIDPLENLSPRGPDACRRIPPPITYAPSAVTTGRLLETSKEVIAVQSFRSELVASGAGPRQYANMVAHKRQFLASWGGHLPVIADVSAGYDGHVVFPGTPSYGHNDAWRNDQSQLRSGHIAGLVFTAWNGYTEGWAGMPTLESGADGTDSEAMNRWLQAIFSSDPRQCSHVHFVDGQPTYAVYGLICEKYYATGGSRGVLGAPISSEHKSATPDVRRTDFEFGSILWKDTPEAYEVHGLIAAKYTNMGYESATSLGLPTSDEQPYDRCKGGRFNQFEKAKLVWCPGWTQAKLVP
jgi:hypothetical protein